MPTLTPRTLGSRVGATAALTALTLAGATWLAAPVAKAAPGDAGDIRIHRVGVPYGVPKDDPVVCKFYLEAANFGELTTVGYTIQAQPPLPSSATVTGAIALGLNSGAGHTDEMTLADGQYRLTWTIGSNPKEKIFRVNCHQDGRHHGGSDRPTEDGHGEHGGAGEHGGPYGPKGGVHAGGGGLVDTAQAFSPVAAAGAVGLVVTSTVAYLRLVRRRPRRAA
ncbi:hypothetical protein [Streptomyces thermodiastaticus]|uniref:hypothetical protein n=1 Tax=Streptomyces thermodiastaticus TaxID=44061 RepID=UPI001677B336|nr:hypothetical protein [Streptomyces thermodiastaticus]MCE7549365.1 hypothetical protein [Streptomyces thermodiastaticus]GHF80474.1 hypothetical protein GCM10018787_31520 [Streptomyces thermodiastaticus]